MKIFLLSLIFGIGFVLGCSKETAPPPPLTAADLPTAFNKAFATAKPDAKQLANQVVSEVQAQNYSQAFNDLQPLINRPDLTKDQMSVATRGVATMQTALQTAAQSQGDTKADETLRTYRSTK